MQNQFINIKWVVAKFPSFILTVMNEIILSLLNYSSMVDLMQLDYFNHYFRPFRSRPAQGTEAEAYDMFDLKSVSSRAIPLSRYIELDVDVLGLTISRVEF